MFLKKLFEVRKEGSNTRKTETASYAVIYEKEGEVLVKYELNDVCHARMTCEVNIGETPLAVVNFICRENSDYLGDDKIRPFLQHIISKESCFSKAILNKDVDDILSNGMIFDVNAPGNMLGAIAVGLRIFWEFPEIGESWIPLHEAGVDGDVAFVLAHQPTKGSDFYTFRGHSGGHKSVSFSSMDHKGLKEVILGKFRFSEKTFKESGGYSPISRIFGNADPWGAPEKDNPAYEWFTPKSRYKRKSVFGEEEILGEPDLKRFCKEAKEYISKVRKDAAKSRDKPQKVAVKKRMRIQDYPEWIRNSPLVASISQKNGFSLGEVMRIRAELRENLLNLPRIPGYAGCEWSLLYAFHWEESPQGHNYWNDILYRLRDINHG